MTVITIHLNAGPNYISFPAVSTENFSMILAGISGMIEVRDGVRLFYKYDPILSPYWISVSDFELIEKGRGYYISVITPGDIVYNGVEYTFTFDQLRSRLLREWNLVGAGSNILSIPNWCKIVDPITGFPVTQIEPTKSYWIEYYDCLQPIIEPYLFISIISLGISIISLFISLRSMRAGPSQIIETK